MVQGWDEATDFPANRQIRAQSGGWPELTDPGATAPSIDSGTVTSFDHPPESSPPRLAPNIGLRVEPNEISVPASPNSDSRSWSTQVPRRSCGGGRAGVLGQPFAAIGARSGRAGNENIRNVFCNSIEGVSFHSNIPLNENLDFQISIGRSAAGTSVTDGGSKFDLDLSVMGVGGGLRGHFLPGETVDPFVFGNLMFLDMDLEASLTQGPAGTYTETESETAIAYNIGMGIQCELEDNIAISPFLGYAEKDEYGNGGASIGALLNIWGGESLLFYLEVSESLEDGTRIFGGGAGLQF